MNTRATAACLLAQLIGLLTIRDVITRGFDPGRFAVLVLLWFALTAGAVLFTLYPEPTER